MSEEKKPSMVTRVVRDLKSNAEAMEADIERTLGKELYYNKVAARLQEALTDSSLVIFDVDEDIEYRVQEAIALVELRVTGLQARINPGTAELHDIFMEIVSEEWVPLVKACRIAARRIKLRGGKAFVKQGLEYVQDIKDTYGAMHVIPWAFKLIARSFGSEFEVVQWVALVSKFSQDTASKKVTVGSSGGTD